MNQNLIEDAKRGGFVSEIMRRLGKLEVDVHNLLAKIGLGRELLKANRTYYVRTDGSDSNDGLSNTAAGAFLTLQKAIDTFLKIDLAGFAGTIQMGSGTYGAGAYLSAPFVGGVVTISGDITTPSNVIISMAGNCIWVDGPSCQLQVKGLKLISSGASGLLAQNYGVIQITGKMDFGACSYTQIYVATGGVIKATGISYDISGGGTHHYRSEEDSTIKISGGTVTVLANITFTSTFATAARAALLEAFGQTYSLGAFTVTGTRYASASNSVIFTNSGGANYFPGTVAGATSTGGQYL